MTPDPERELERQRAARRGEHPMIIHALANPMCQTCQREMHGTSRDELWHEYRYECDCGAWVEISA